MTRKLLSLALIAMLLAMFIPSAYAITTMYVYTENGGHLNVRSGPFVGDNIIGKLEYGDQVGVESYVNGWAIIVGAHGPSYVQARYLTNYYPGPKPVRPSSNKPASTKPASSSSSSSSSGAGLSAINEQFRAAKQVQVPYIVRVRPSRASGWVNFRWAPSADAQKITSFGQDHELRVLAELKTWLQVQDIETGNIGFISQNYVTRK